LHKKVGDSVRRGEPLATLYASERPIGDDLIRRVTAAFEIRQAPAAPLPVILGIIDRDGRKDWPV